MCMTEHIIDDGRTQRPSEPSLVPSAAYTLERSATSPVNRPGLSALEFTFLSGDAIAARSTQTPLGL